LGIECSLGKLGGCCREHRYHDQGRELTAWWKKQGGPAGHHRTALAVSTQDPTQRSKQ